MYASEALEESRKIFTPAETFEMSYRQGGRLLKLPMFNF